MIPDAPCRRETPQALQLVSNFLHSTVPKMERRIKELIEQAYILTEINLAPIQTRFGDGNGSINLPTPYIATAKKWSTKLNGRGFNPESRETGPVENMPPRLR